jgi:uncharacterized protein
MAQMHPARSNLDRRHSHAPTKKSTALACFVVIAFLWAWGFGYLAGQLKSGAPILNITLMITAGYAPTLAAIGVVALCNGRAGLLAWLARCLNWRVNWKWHVLAFSVPPFVMVTALCIHFSLGGALPSFPAANKMPLAIANFGLVFLIGGPLGEEFGWRGFLTPALRSWMDWRAVSLIVGVIWGAWHLPLFFMAGTAQAHMPIAIFLVNILAGSVLFGWLFERSKGSVLPAIVAHTSLNTWAGLLGIVPTLQSGQPYTIVTAILVAIAMGLLLVPSRNQSLAARVKG